MEKYIVPGLLGFMILILVIIMLYEYFDMFKYLCHNIFGIHKPDNDCMEYKNGIYYSKCKFCKVKIMRTIEDGAWYTIADTYNLDLCAECYRNIFDLDNDYVVVLTDSTHLCHNCLEVKHIVKKFKKRGK